MSDYGTHHPSIDNPNAWVPYRYVPSLAAACVAVALFGLATIAHLYILVRRRTWYFIPFIVGGLFEVAGYIGRISSHFNTWALGPYIDQSILLLVAPCLFAASIYITFGRIIRYTHGESSSLIPREWLTRVFVTGDVVSFLLQVGGGGYQAVGTLAALNNGNDIIITGLFTQLASFAIFMGVSVIFHVRFHHRCGADPDLAAATAGHPKLWRKYMWVLYAGSLLIFIRCIFRAVEYLMGNDGYLLRHEVFLYIYDGLLMLGVMCIFLVFHPANITRFIDESEHMGSAKSRGGRDACDFQLLER